MRIVVDRQICIGAAACVIVAGKTFQLDAEGKAEVVNGAAKEQTEETSAALSSIENDDCQTIIDGALSCPVNAIHLYEDDGTQIV